MERLEKEKNINFLLACCSQGILKGKVFWTISVIQELGGTESKIYIFTPHQNQTNKRMTKESSERKV